VKEALLAKSIEHYGGEGNGHIQLGRSSRALWSKIVGEKGKEVLGEGKKILEEGSPKRDVPVNNNPGGGAALVGYMHSDTSKKKSRPWEIHF